MSNAPLVTAVTVSQQTRAAVNNIKGVSALLYACQQGDVEKVYRILRAQSTAYLERDRTGKSALHYCCTSDHISAAQAADILVMAAPDLVDSRDQEGFTPLHLAVIAGNMPLVTFLLANNADVNAVDNEKHTVVHWATVCGETVTLRAVLAAGAPVSTPDVHRGYPLHYAAQMCGGEKDPSLGLQVLHTLLSHEDISVTVEDGDGRPPLLWAASAGSAKAVLALIRAGTPVEAHDKDGLTALHCAASRGHTDCIDTLLTLCGASPDVIDRHADATSLLLSHSADANRQDRKGRSPAHCGCAKGQLETVKMLGNHGANLWLRNARGDLPLHEAAASGRRDLVRWLLEARPSQVNARNNDGRCPLHLAALNDNADMCKILLDAGAQINPILRTSKNVFMTPMDCALQRGFRSTAKYLQLHGGLPANRVSGVSQRPLVSSAVSLHIRDDVTLWGGSSSEGESDELNLKKTKKKVYKRKSAYKYEKKKEHSSISDIDAKISNGKLPKQDFVKSDENQNKDTKYMTMSNNHRGEIFIYANEVNISDKLGEITITQNSEITLSESAEVLSKSKTNGDLKKYNGSSEKRPKSAKYGRLKNSTKKSNENNLKQPRSDTPQTIQNNILETTNNEISNTTTKIVNDSNTVKQVLEANTHASNTDDYNKTNQKSPTNRKTEMLQNELDRQSLKSNTSLEDLEDHKEVVVEVSVHTPPKEIKTDVSDSNADIEEPKQHQNVIESKTKIVEKEPDTIVNNTTQQTIGNDVTQNLEQEIISTVYNKESCPDSNISENKKQIPLTTVEDEKSEKNTTESDPTAHIKKSPRVQDENNKKSIVQLKEVDETNDKENEDIQLIEDMPNKIGVIIKSKKELNENEQIFKTSAQSSEEKTTDSNIIRSKEEETTTSTTNKKQETNKFNKSNEQKQTVTKKNKSKIDELSSENTDFSPANVTEKRHPSFKVLNDDECVNNKYSKENSHNNSPTKVLKSNEEKCFTQQFNKDHEKLRRSKIPTPINLKTPLSKSDKYLERYEKQEYSSMDIRIPSLPNIYDGKEMSERHPRSISNLSAPLASTYSDNDRETGSDAEEISSATKKKKLKKRSKTRNAKSAGSDYESSNLIDSGFEPSPRSTRLPKSKHITDRGVNMTSVTQTIQSNIRRYHLERKIFQHLLDLKRLQIRSGQHNEAVLVKRAIDAYHKSCAATVGAGRYLSEDYTFKNFERFLYNSLRKIQRNGSEHLQGLPETSRNPLFCTQSTHRCDHATHAYTGVPCAAYLPKMNHHNIPKIGFDCKPSGFLPKILPKNAVTLELCHGNDKQVISLPAERLDQNKRYYVTFTVKGTENNDEEVNGKITTANHLHSKSD
ncbi:hypothetical protein RN001_000760 [Aquatica leii]|uniref:Inversin n=1 Tax=Aquatica leii TaxID=1421715 RepID=A0AAN7SKS9_9COLE|nr:hypothetical protein RN001_000760 [Aquatica leii]